MRRLTILIAAFLAAMLFVAAPASAQNQHIGYPVMCSDSETAPTVAGSRWRTCAQMNAGVGPATPMYFRLLDGDSLLLGDVINSATVYGGGIGAIPNGLLTWSPVLGLDTSTNRWEGVHLDIPAATLTMTADFALETISVGYYWDGTTHRRYAGGQLNADNIAATTYAPDSRSFNFFYDETNGDWSRDTGDALDSDAVATTSEAPRRAAFGHVYQTDDASWSRLQGETGDGGTLAATVDAAYNFGLVYGWDGSTWSPADVVTTQADGLAFTQNGLFTTGVMYLSNGATLDMARSTANGGLQVGIETWHNSYDSGNGWQKVKKEEVAVYDPAATTGTAVDDAGTDVVCASTYVLDLPNWTVMVKNAGGGSGDAFSDVDVQVSYDETTWTSLTSTACDALTSGQVGVCYEASAVAYPYVRVVAATGGGDDTTADCKIVGNKN